MQGGKKTTERKSTGTDWERVKREAAQDARGRPAVAVKRPTLNMRVDAEE